jgi:hypothetical protein
MSDPIHFDKPKRSISKGDRLKRRRIVQQHYDDVGHGSEYSIHVWRPLFPEGTTDAQIYGAISAFERATGKWRHVWHPTPQGFQSKSDRKIAKYATTMD